MPWTTKRGQSRRSRRPTPAMPSTTLALSRISATAPVERVRYQRALGPAAASIVSRGRAASRPSGSRSRRRRRAGRAGRVLEPCRRPLAANDRGGAGDVGVDACRCGDADRPPVLARGSARRRVENMVEALRAANPAAKRRARGGKASGGDRNRLTGAAPRRAGCPRRRERSSPRPEWRRRWRCRRRG